MESAQKKGVIRKGGYDAFVARIKNATAQHEKCWQRSGE
jgi:hypothetical protein